MYTLGKISDNFINITITFYKTGMNTDGEC